MGGRKSLSSEYSRPSVFTPFLRRFTDERARDLSETIRLYEQVRATYLGSLWANPESIQHVHSLIAERVGEAVHLPSSSALLEALDRCQKELLVLETTIFAFPEINPRTAVLSLREHVDLRQFLRAKQHFLANEERVAGILMDTLAGVFEAIVAALPDVQDTTDLAPPLTVPIICLMRDPGDLIARLIATICQRESAEAGLFSTLQDRLYRNVCLASGISPGDEKPRKRLVEADHSDLASVELAEVYLGETPFLDLFLCPVPFNVPARTRFEHQWIVAPPGAGKSTLLQYLILRDLDLVAADQASIVVMESNRDLIKAIEGLKVFAPGERLDGKLVVIDAEDIEWPVALNLFDVSIGDLHSYSPAEHEGFRNAVLALYDYIFSALLSAEMTSRQNTLFHFTIELLLTIPSATLDTLIDLMQPGGLAKFQDHLAKLDPDARRFFDLKFNSKEFDRTKEQVVDRLFAVKRIRTLSRMFSAPRSKFDFFTEMSAGKVILINVPQSLLQEDGVEIVGRFFISMILLAAHKRQLLPKEHRLPCFVYIDECQDFIKRDPKIPVILDQARKLNVGLILAHQRLQQMQSHVLDALYGATAIKFASKISDAAAHALARDMRTTPEFILNQPLYHFAAYIRGMTNTALSIGIPATDFTKLPRMAAAERAAVRRSIRERYSIGPEAPGRVQEESSATPTIPAPAHPTEPDPGSDDWRS